MSMELFAFPYLGDFYDDAGSRLFDDITRLPEYYLTRAESAILERHAAAIIRRHRDKYPTAWQEVLLEKGARILAKHGRLDEVSKPT